MLLEQGRILEISWARDISWYMMIRGLERMCPLTQPSPTRGEGRDEGRTLPELFQIEAELLQAGAEGARLEAEDGGGTV